MPPRIAPFRALVYSKEKVPDLSQVVAPPYDVISPSLQEELYQRHPYNVVRLILGKTSPSDREGEDRYSRAARDLKTWIREGILVRDQEPCLYLYEQEFSYGGELHRRQGFIALCRLEPFGGKIFPHERTLSAPKEDRLHLIRSCEANLSPVFSLYRDLKGEVRGHLGRFFSCVPDREILESEVRHRLWRVPNQGVIQTVSRLMDKTELLVADGHHRYETSLRYAQEMAVLHPNEEASFRYVMMFFLELGDRGLRILPTHRIVPEKGGELKARLPRLGQFQIESFGDRRRFQERLQSLRGSRAFGLAVSDERWVVSGPRSSARLDVLFAHDFLKVIGLSREEEEGILYTKSADEVFSALEKSPGSLGILLNPPEPHELWEVVTEGIRLPPKTTFFYPKPLSGLVFHPLGPSEKVSI